ncbi:MAG TPA: putative glycolipid-binding domain-containing protein, partial [Thermoplasmata archaeon]|nr:putative glycolipid-binding domain-containing protein [Thermoplasmata archaeon]
TESFLLSRDETGWHLEGNVVALLDREPAHIRYRVVCDPSWRALSAQISQDRAGAQRELHLTVRDDGRWWVEGEEDARLRQCTDIDLEISPSTSTIPIRRLNLAVGQESEVIAAWVRFPALTAEPLHQRYSRTGANRYRYASRDFATELEVDDLGLVTRYEGGWSREAAAQPDSSTLK